MNPNCPGGEIVPKKVTYDGIEYDDYICVGTIDLNPHYEGKSLCVIQNKITCKGDCVKSMEKDASGDLDIEKYTCNVGCMYGMALQNSPPPPTEETIEYVDNA